MTDLLSLVTPYEASLLETVDDLELFVWWRETRNDPANKWARLLSEDLSVELYDAGLRNVEALGHQRQQAILSTVVRTGASLDPPLYHRVMLAARAWEKWPRAFRRELAAAHSLRYGDG